jgi:hypothetical protein
MIDDKKIKRLQEYFAKKREIEENQLTNFREHKVAVASLQQVQERIELTEAADIAISNKSQKSGISVKTLQEIYRRGVFAWNEKSNMTAQQMGFARINSFISRGQSFYSDDRDLAIKEQLDKKTLTTQELVKIEKKKLSEDLRKWFSKSHPEGGWKRINSKGEVVGPCARKPGEPKPKCMSNEKRAKLTKKQRASAVAAKRKHDPVADRSGKGGKPINVSNFGKGNISK